MCLLYWDINFPGFEYELIRSKVGYNILYRYKFEEYYWKSYNNF